MRRRDRYSEGAKPKLLLGLVALLSACAFDVARDRRLDRCGVRGEVLRSVELAQARHFTDLVGRTIDPPELQVDAPAVAFFYKDPVEVPISRQREGRNGPIRQVVCVVVEGVSEAYVYANVEGVPR